MRNRPGSIERERPCRVWLLSARIWARPNRLARCPATLDFGPALMTLALWRYRGRPVIPGRAGFGANPESRGVRLLDSGFALRAARNDAFTSPRNSDRRRPRAGPR